MHPISKRIKVLARLTNGSSYLYDCGCDHGLVIKEALVNKYIKKAMASDIAPGPLARAKLNLEKYKSQVSFHLMDGLNSIHEKVDAILIAGMGGLLIKDILESHLINNTNFDNYNKKFILQPNSKQDVLRSFLLNNNFYISQDFVVMDKEKFYQVLVVFYNNEKKNNKTEYYSDVFLDNYNHAKTNKMFTDDIYQYFLYQYSYLKSLSYKDVLDESKQKLYNKLLFLEKLIK